MGRPFCSSCIVFRSPFLFFVVMHEGMRKTKNGDGKSMRMEIGKQGNQGKQRKQNTVKQVPILPLGRAPLILSPPPESIRVRVLVGQPVRSVFFVSCFPRVRVKRWCAPVRAACAQFRTHSALASCMRRETDNRLLTLLYRSWHSPWSNPDWSLDCRRRQKCKLWLAWGGQMLSGICRYQLLRSVHFIMIGNWECNSSSPRVPCCHLASWQPCAHKKGWHSTSWRDRAPSKPDKIWSRSLSTEQRRYTGVATVTPAPCMPPLNPFYTEMYLPVTVHRARM